MGLIQFEGQPWKRPARGIDKGWQKLGLRQLIVPGDPWDQVSNSGVSLVGGQGVIADRFDFPASTSYVEFATGGGVVSQNSHTVVFVSLLRAFYSLYPFVSNYQTATARRAVWYSSDAAYTDLMWNAGFVSRNRFTFPSSVPVLNNEHTIVLRGNGSSADSSASGWVNGKPMALATVADTAGSVSGNSVLGQQGVGSYANRLNGQIGIFALFEGSLSDALCEDLSFDAWDIFKKRRIWVPVGAAPPSGTPILSNLQATAITGTTARLRMTFTVPT